MCWVSVCVQIDKNMCIYIYIEREREDVDIGSYMRLVGRYILQLPWHSPPKVASSYTCELRALCFEATISQAQGRTHRKVFQSIPLIPICLQCGPHAPCFLECTRQVLPKGNSCKLPGCVIARNLLPVHSGNPRHPKCRCALNFGGLAAFLLELPVGIVLKTLCYRSL